VTIKNFANEFISLIRSLKLTDVHLVGHSTGGTVAALMLALAPELFTKAYLLDPVGAEGVQFNEQMIQAFESMKADKNLTATVIGSTIYNNNPDSNFFKDVIVEDAFKSVKAVGHLVLKALDGLNIREELKSVSVPVKVVHGEFDQLLSVEESKKMALLFKEGHFEILQGVGHCANIEKTEMFVDSFRKFLYS
jgi:3-oxoadipate enol-lactonase